MERISLFIDNRKIDVRKGATVLEAIQTAGIYVPTLCHDPALKPYGACRLCIVKIDQVRGLPTSCTTPAEEKMVVTTETEEIQKVRRIIVELVIANHPMECLICNKSQTCELLQVARYLGVEKNSVDRLRKIISAKDTDRSNPAFDIDHSKCILCGKCVRACNEIQGKGAIDFAFRGYQTRVATFDVRPIIESICQSCGECVERCPTGALSIKYAVAPQKEVKSICPYCGVGCAINLGVRGQKIVSVTGVKDGPANQGELCVKGRFGYDFVNHPDRLTRPLIRKDNTPKNANYMDKSMIFREAGWDEALERVVNGLALARDNYGPDAIGVLSSAKCTNETNYMVQKFARTVIGTNNVDHCARLCHASTVAAAFESFGGGAMSNSFSDIDLADLLFVIGSNTTECHPIVGRRIKRAVNSHQAALMVADPRSIELSNLADIFLNHQPGTDVALLNGIMQQIIAHGLHNETFLKDRCENVEVFLDSLEEYTLEKTEAITGVPGEKIREAAIAFGRAKSAIIFYGMGITQHTTGTDNVKAIANLLMLTGNIGRTGTGFAPLRGQNNVQGACDMGVLPNVYPGYQRVSDPLIKAKFEKAWEKNLSDKPGLTIPDMIHAAYQGTLKSMYIIGENPMMSEPDLNHVRQALSRLDFLIVQDIFPTETAQLADIVLPATCFSEKDGTFTNTERRVQLLHKAVEPPGEARLDWEIVSEIAARMGYSLMIYKSSADIMDEIAELTPTYHGISHDRLRNTGGLQWPCWNLHHPGTPILHEKEFPRGRGKLHVVHYRPPAELPTPEYPLLMGTGRVLEHFHTGSMSHRSRVLETLIPEGWVEISDVDLENLNMKDGDKIKLSSPRGQIQTRAKRSDRMRPGQTFMAFHWQEAPANFLTNPAVDDTAKIPEFKISSVKAEPVKD